MVEKTGREFKDYRSEQNALMSAYLDRLRRDDEEDDISRDIYGSPLGARFLGGGVPLAGSDVYSGNSGSRGGSLPPASYAALQGNPALMSAPQRGYSSQLSQALSEPRSVMNITYNAPDGTSYQMSAKFSPGSRDSVVDGLMKAAYGLVMSHDYSGQGKKASPSGSYKGGKAKGYSGGGK